MFKTIDIFPTTILEFQDPNSESNCDRLQTLLDQQPYTNDAQPFQTIDNHLELDPDFKFFYDWVNQCLAEFHSSFQFDCDRFEICLSWANKCHPLNMHRAHTHPNSFISGIYYITDSKAHTCFEDPRHNINMLSVATPSNWAIRPWASESQKGSLILFPSWLSHFTTVLPENENVRHTISFNVFPRGLVNGKSNRLNEIFI